jgi:hypothetical protein
MQENEWLSLILCRLLNADGTFFYRQSDGKINLSPFFDYLRKELI